MEEAPKREYVLSQAEKDQVDELLRVLSSPTETDRIKKAAASTLSFDLFSPWSDAKPSMYY